MWCFAYIFLTPDLGHPVRNYDAFHPFSYTRPRSPPWIYCIFRTFFLTPDLGDPLIGFVVFFIYFHTQDLGHPLDLLYFSYIFPTPDEGHPHLANRRNTRNDAAK